MVDTQRSGRCFPREVEVQVLSTAPGLRPCGATACGPGERLNTTDSMDLKKLRSCFDSLLAKKKNPIVFICGLGASGKTTLAQQLRTLFPECLSTLHLDWYLKHSTEERKQRIVKAKLSGDKKVVEKEENPRNWYDWDAFEQDLLNFQKTGKVKIDGIWNQKSGKKDLNMELSIDQNTQGIIICAGVFDMGIF